MITMTMSDREISEQVRFFGEHNYLIKHYDYTYIVEDDTDMTFEEMYELLKREIIKEIGAVQIEHNHYDKDATNIENIRLRYDYTLQAMAFSFTLLSETEVAAKRIYTIMTMNDI